MFLLVISVTVGALVFTGLLFATLFRYLNRYPANLAGDYVGCTDWHEAHLNQCSVGLVKIPQQPVNTYTNLAYLAAGLPITLVVQTEPAWVFLGVMSYLTIGSAMYHATANRWAGMMDVTAIFATYSAMTVFALCGLLAIQGWLGALAMFVIAGVVVYWLAPRYKRNTNLIIGIFLGAAYILQVIHMAIEGDWSSWRWIVGSFVLFLLAFWVWNLDKRQVFFIAGWGHGLWHVFTAAASALLFYGIHIAP